MAELTGCRLMARSPGLNVLASVAIAFGLLATSMGVASAQRTTEADGLNPTFDLAAVILPAETFPIPVGGLTVDEGYLYSAEGYAADLGIDVDQLIDAGFRGKHQTFYAALSEDDETLYSATARTYVVEYADEDGAAELFEFEEDESDNPDAEDIDFPTYGDQSELTVSTGTADDGTAFEDVDFTAQVGSVHVGFSIILWEISGLTVEEDLDLADLEPLAEALLDQLDAAQERDSGVFFRAPRFVAGDGSEILFNYEDYLVLDGTFYPNPAQPEVPEDTEDMVDSYSVQSFVYPEGEDALELEIALIVSVEQYSDSDAAVAYLETRSENPGLNEEAGYSNIEPVEDEALLPEPDGEVVAYTYEYALSDDLTTSGIQYYVQQDDIVLGFAVDASAGVNVEAVLDLLNEGLDCLAADGFCAPIPVPIAIAGE